MTTQILKLKTEIIGGDLRGWALHFLLWSFGVLAAFYLFLLGSMVVNIIERKASQAQMYTLANEVANLELTYLSVSNKVDLPFSYSLGFVETKAKFAVRRSLGSLGSLKVTENEI